MPGEDVAEFTEAPSATLISAILPPRWAVISFSIFIASITGMRSPSATSWPCSAATLKTVPWSSEGGKLGAARRAAAAGGAFAPRRPPRSGRVPARAGRRRRSPHRVEPAINLDGVGALDRVLSRGPPPT